jgi:hypothetical protein
MKTILTLTAALIGGVALPALAFAGTTEAVTGCATEAVEGSNYTTFVDPTCPAQARDGGDLRGSVIALLSDVWVKPTPDETEEAEAD